MDFEGAILAHSKWKRRLRDAIDGKQVLDAAQVAKDDLCDLGKWLHGEGKMAHAADPAFEPLRDEHARFHKAAAAVVERINDGDRQKAAEMLGMTGQFSRCSTLVVASITKLRDNAAKRH